MRRSVGGDGWRQTDRTVGGQYIARWPRPGRSGDLIFKEGAYALPRAGNVRYAVVSQGQFASLAVGVEVVDPRAAMDVFTERANGRPSGAARAAEPLCHPAGRAAASGRAAQRG